MSDSFGIAPLPLSRPPFNPRTFTTAEELWEFFLEYVQACKDNPIAEDKIFNGKEGLRYATQEHPRPMRIASFSTFLGVSRNTWYSWKKKFEEAGNQTVLATFEVIEESIKNQQYEHAAVNMYNASVVSRELGLVEKQELTSGLTVVIEKEDADL